MVNCVWCDIPLKGKQTMFCSRGCQLNQWKKDNPTRVKQHLDKYRKANPEKHNQLNRKWRENNPEKQKEILKRAFNKQKEKYPLKIKSRNYVSNNNQRGKYCQLCNNTDNLEFHHTNYEKNEGFTVCEEDHRDYCKEGRCFEDSLRIYEVNICG